jgi:Tfp pilus assembly protein PilO
VKKQVSLTPVLAIALAIIVAATYFVLIRPKAAESARLDEEVAELEAQAAVAPTQPNNPQPRVQIDVADLFRLAKALPDGSDIAGIMLELNAMASASGIEFVSIQPGEPVSFTDYSALPITLTFHGNYYDLTDFLYRMRNLVTVRDGVLDAAGRLYTLDVLDLHEAPEQSFPKIEAVLTLSAFSYGAVTTPATPGAPAATTTSDATDTTQSFSTETTTTGTTTETTTGTDATEAAGAGS